VNGFIYEFVIRSSRGLNILYETVPHIFDGNVTIEGSSPPSLVTFEFCVATRRFVGCVRRESREHVLAAFAVNVTEVARKARREIVIFFCRDNSGQRDLFASRGVPWRTLADRKNRMPARKAGLAVSKTEVKRKVR